MQHFTGSFAELKAKIDAMANPALGIVSAETIKTLEDAGFIILKKRHWLNTLLAHTDEMCVAGVLGAELLKRGMSEAEIDALTQKERLNGSSS